MTRCFLGFEFTPSTLDYLRERILPFHYRLVDELNWPLRLVRPENWHVTILFFEGLDTPERNKVRERMEALVSGNPLEGTAFGWKGFSLWPSPRKPSLICLEATQTTASLKWGLPISEPPFSKGHIHHFLEYRPHATLMRFKGKGRAMGKDWEALKKEMPVIQPEQIRVDRISLFLSTLTREKPVYPREFTLPINIKGS